jgi:DegT/DnrJ/EryC1/StrS aminotransferase family
MPQDVARGVDYVLAVSSGTAAIALGLLSLGLEPGSLVACPGFTFAATPGLRSQSKEPQPPFCRSPRTAPGDGRPTN